MVPPPPLALSPLLEEHGCLIFLLECFPVLSDARKHGFPHDVMHDLGIDITISY